MVAGSGPETVRKATALGGSYCQTSQTHLIRRLRNATSSSVIEPTRNGPGEIFSCLRETATHVGSFSGVEMYSKTRSTGCLMVALRATRICEAPFPSCGWYP